jgi:hypothetical protein
MKALASGALGLIIGFGLHAVYFTPPVSTVALEAANTALVIYASRPPAPGCTPSPTAVEAAAPADTPKPPTAAQAQAAETKGKLLSQALAAGSWTEADAMAARQLLPTLAPVDQRALLSEIAMGINSGKLKLNATRPF